MCGHCAMLGYAMHLSNSVVLPANRQPVNISNSIKVLALLTGGLISKKALENSVLVPNVSDTMSLTYPCIGK